MDEAPVEVVETAEVAALTNVHQHCFEDDVQILVQRRVAMGLEDLENIVHHASRAYVKAGLALGMIHERRLYLSVGYATFETYVAHRLGIGATWAKQMVTAAKVALSLAERGRMIPSTPSAALPLANIKDPDRRAEVWDQVVAQAGENDRVAEPPTRANVRRAVIRAEPTANRKTSLDRHDAPPLEPVGPPDEEMRQSVVADARREVEVVQQMLGALSRKFRELLRSPAGAYLRPPNVQNHLLSLYRMLKQSKAAALCEACKGEGCKQCRMTGFIPLTTAQLTIKDFKDYDEDDDDLDSAT